MRSILKFLIFLFIALTGLAVDKPNIVLLFSDDAGYADFGFQGSDKFMTPHLDRLASEGIRMSQFYVSGSTCGPSRAGLLTGRYQQRLGFEENNVPGIMSENGKLMGDDMGLPVDMPTIGDHLQGLGYKTGIFGKWHMGIADRYHPTRRGFDVFYGFRGGARSFFPYNNDPGGGRLMERGFADYKEHEGYLTDAIASEACAFIEANKDQPFFAYVSFNAVHTPMEPDPNDADTFPELEGKRRKAAQMTLSLDRACGSIVAKLDELGIRENTLVIFTNDNGGPSDRNGSSNYPHAGTKAVQLEGGIRVPGIVSWPGKLPQGSVYEYPMITLDFLPTFVKLGENTSRPHETLYWKVESRATIRDGDWKMMRFPNRPALLFDLTNDPGEQNDLAGENPELVKELYKKLFAWEMELERPLFLLRRQEEAWAAERFNQFRKPPSKDY
jgi:arylsulfatase A-like enzyme